jgi:hypothetical protein
MIFVIYDSFGQILYPVEGTSYLFRDSFGNPLDIRSGTDWMGRPLTIHYFNDSTSMVISPDEYLRLYSLREKSYKRDKLIEEIIK